MADLAQNARRLLERARAAAAALSLGPLDLRTSSMTDGLQLEADSSEDTLILGYYTLAGLRRAYERYGFLDRVRDRGYRQLKLHGIERPAGPPMLRLEGRHERTKRKHVLMEVVASRDRHKFEDHPRSVLYIDWVLLQDPEREFTKRRPQLPGQEHPGLGVGLLLEEMMRQVSLRLELGGVVDRPAHYHNRALGRGVFVDPELEGRFQILREHLSDLTLAEASHAVEEGRVVDRDGQPVLWRPGLRLLAADRHAFEVLEAAPRQSAIVEAQELWANRLAGARIAPRK